MIPLAVCTTEETPNAFQWAGKPHRIAPAHGRISTPSNTWFFARTRVCLLNGISSFFAQYICDLHTQTDTDRHTDHATGNNCSNRLHLMH